MADPHIILFVVISCYSFVSSVPLSPNTQNLLLEDDTSGQSQIPHGAITITGGRFDTNLNELTNNINVDISRKFDISRDIGNGGFINDPSVISFTNRHMSGDGDLSVTNSPSEQSQIHNELFNIPGSGQSIDYKYIKSQTFYPQPKLHKTSYRMTSGNGHKPHQHTHLPHKHIPHRHRCRRSYKNHTRCRRSYKNHTRKAVRIGVNLLRELEQTPIGKHELCETRNPTIVKSAEAILDKIRQIEHNCQQLESQILLRDVISQHKDMDHALSLISRLMDAMAVIIQFGIHEADCELGPTNLVNQAKQNILEGSDMDLALDDTLIDLDKMITGQSAYLGWISLPQLYEERLPTSLKQSKKWYVEGFIEYLTLLQAAGYAIYNINANIEGTEDFVLFTVNEFQELTKQQEKSLHTWMTKIRDIYVNNEIGQFFNFSARFSNAVYINTGVLGNTPTENDDVSKLVHIKGCRLVEQAQNLAFRCSVFDNNSCGNSTNTTTLLTTEDTHRTQIIEAKAFNTDTKLHNSRYLIVSNKHIEVSTSWVRTHRPDQTVCAIKLNPIEDKDCSNETSNSHCLGLGVYFCSTTCGADQKWMYSRPAKNLRQYWSSWSTGGYQVDSHLTMPQYDGRVTGVRLNNKHGRLAIELKTSFEV